MIVERPRDLERVANAKLIEQRSEDQNLTRYFFVRKAPWGEKFNVGIALKDHDRYSMNRADEREYFMNVAREASNRLDHMINEKHSERIAKGLPVDKVSSAGVALTPGSVWEEPGKSKSPHHKAPASGKKKIAITDKTIAAAKEEHDMKTASETFDAIKAALAQLNIDAQPKYRGSFYECDIWFEAYDESFQVAHVVESEPYTLDRIVYSDRLDAICVVMSPANTEEKTVFVTIYDLEDAFPELYHALSGMLVGFNSLRELDHAVTSLTRGRAAFKKALAEASYASLGAATKAAAEKKQMETEAFYTANPIYGLL